MDAETLTKIITKDLNIGLYPHFIGKEKSAVNNLLKERKFKYNQDLNGILIRYDNLKFLSDTGQIIDDCPLIYWKIRANFHIFYVQNDQIIKSFVNRIGKKYIGCSIANCVNVTIKFDETIEEEIEDFILFSKLDINDPIVFKVKAFTPSQYYIEGIIDKEVFHLLKENFDKKN